MRAQQLHPAHQARQRRAELVRGLLRHAHPDHALLGRADAAEAREPEQQQQTRAGDRDERHPAQLLEHGRIAEVQVSHHGSIRRLAQRDRGVDAIERLALCLHALDARQDLLGNGHTGGGAVARARRHVCRVDRDVAPGARCAGRVGDDDREADALCQLAEHALDLRVRRGRQRRLRGDLGQQLRGLGHFPRELVHGGLREHEHRHDEHAAAGEQCRLEQRLARGRGAADGTDHAGFPSRRILRQARQAPGVSTSRPPRYGRSAFGSTTEPSACWWFSSSVA